MVGLVFRSVRLNARSLSPRLLLIGVIGVVVRMPAPPPLSYVVALASCEAFVCLQISAHPQTIIVAGFSLFLHACWLCVSFAVAGEVSNPNVHRVDAVMISKAVRKPASFAVNYPDVVFTSSS